MREILTIIAACLVVALTAALAIPPFVDWDAQRGRVETRLASVFGGTVEIGGPVSVRLLPAPRLDVGSLALQRPGLQLRSASARFELSPTALMQGRFDLTEASLQTPVISVDPARLSLDQSARARVGIERLSISDGALHVAGEKPIDLAHFDVEAAADSLSGPFRGKGAWRGPRAISFAFSTGALEDQRLRGKIALDVAAQAHVEIDGDVSFEKGAPAFSGNAIASGAGDGAPWRARSALRATPAGFNAENLELRLGDEDHALNATGEADYAPGATLSMRLSARNLDLDRFRSNYGLAPLEAIRAIALSLDLSADSATLGGDTIASPSLALRLQPDRPAQVAVDAELPARSRLHYSGALDPARGAFDGDVRVSTRDGKGLAAWLAPAAPDIARLVASAPFSGMSIVAHVAGSSEGVRTRIAEAQLDRSRLAGDISWTPPGAGSRAKLAARLTSPALDIDGLPDLGGLAAIDAGVDLSIALDAQAVKIARLGMASADAGRIGLRVSRDEQGLLIDEVSIANLGGASLSGSGRFTSRGGGVDLKLKATRLADLAGLLRRVAPGPASETFAARAAALSPADLSLSISTSGVGGLREVDVAGTAGGTKLTARVQPNASDASRLDAFARAENPDAAVLLRQAGFQVLPLKGMGAASIEARGQGALGGVLHMQAQADVAGAGLRFDGDADIALDHAAANGRLSLSSADVTPLLQLLALGAPDLTQRIAARVEGRIRADASGLGLDDLSGTIGGAQVSGALAQTRQGAFTGALSFDALSAPFLASLILGPAQPTPARAQWAQLKFAPASFDLPSATLDVSAARVELGGAGARDARFRLTSGPGSLAFSDLSMRVGEGRVSGEGQMRREGAAASVRARLSAEDLRVLSGPFSGKVAGHVDIAGAGASAAELVGSLAGSGGVHFEEMRIQRAALDTLGPAIAAADSGEAVARAAILRTLGSALDAGQQALEPFDAGLTLAAGRLVAAPTEVRSGATAIRLGAALDLRTLTLELSEAARLQPPKGWDGAAPKLDILWKGDLASPTRSVEADSLISALAERAIAREVARNEALEADIRERAFFNRRLKFDRRLEADRLAEEEARRAAAEVEQERVERAQKQREQDLREQAAREQAINQAAREQRERAERDRIERERRARARESAPAVRRAPVEARSPEAQGGQRQPAAPIAPDPSTWGRY